MHLPVVILLAVAAAGALAGVGGAGFLKGPMRVVRALNSGRERIRLLLERVEKEESPEFVMGAMCYAPMAFPERVEYVCPVCGERTFFAYSEAGVLQWDIHAMRRLVEEMGDNGFFEAALVETFCGNCHPGETPGVSLRLVYAPGDTVVTPVTLSDLQMISALIQGRLSYFTGNDSQAPLKEHTDRLRSILGMEPEQEVEP
jgi:hypothetical protein